MKRMLKPYLTLKATLSEFEATLIHAIKVWLAIHRPHKRYGTVAILDGDKNILAFDYSWSDTTVEVSLAVDLYPDTEFIQLDTL
jgi:hypothetical protein